MNNKTEILVFDTKVRVIRIDDADYFCITDLAKYKNPDNPDMIIRSWLNTKRELEFLQEWEQAYNLDFKTTISSSFKGFEKYVVEVFLKNLSSIGKWISYTNAKGIITKRGRYGGTYAHTTIALNFANYIHAKFYIRLLEEYQTLKQQQTQLLGDPFAIKRHLAAGNYTLLVASIFSQMDERLLTHPQPYKSRLPFAAEIDMINQIIFGQTAKQWRVNNPDKPTNRNQRDYASVLDLAVLHNLEFMAAMLLQWDMPDIKERRIVLQETYDFIYPILKRAKTIQRLQNLADVTNK